MPTPNSLGDLLAESLSKIAGEFVRESAGLRDEGPYWTAAGTPRMGGVPYYEWSWSDLNDARDASRRMLTHNEFAIGGLRTRSAYIVDQGFDFQIAPREGQAVTRQEARDLKDWLRLFASANGLATQSKRAQYRYDADGGVIWRIFPDSSGVADVRFVRPERLRPPGTAGSDADPADPEKWGVVVEQGDAERVTAYWVEPRVGGEAEEVPEAEIVHHYASDDGALPVGIPIYQPVFQNLKRCEDLLTSMSAIAKARAKIAIIRYVSGLNEVKADNIRSQLLSGRQQQPDGTSAAVNVEQLAYGTVVRVSDKERLEFPNANVGASDLIQVLQADLRSVGSLLTMPEWMFTGLADQKYSNAFVVEAPTLKVFRNLQGSLVEKIGTGRYRQEASVIWRALRLASEAGHFSRDLLARVEVKVTHPSLEVRDKSGEASTNTAYLAAGVLDRQTVRESLGLDNAEIARRIEEQKREAPSVPPPTPPGEGDPKPPEVVQEAHQANPPFPGGEFDEASHRWRKKGGAQVKAAPAKPASPPANAPAKPASPPANAPKKPAKVAKGGPRAANNKGAAGRDAAPKERAAAKAFAAAKVAAAPVPGPEEVAKGRAALKKCSDYAAAAAKMKATGKDADQIKAALGSEPRAGGDMRGNDAARKARARKLFAEQGGEKKGYVVCHGNGMKMHWTDDPAVNPEGYPKFQQGKIFVAHQGGSYKMENLLPESKAWNSSRNDEVVRPENTT